MAERRKREQALQITKGAFFLSLAFVSVLLAGLYYVSARLLPSFPLTEQSCTTPLAEGMVFLVKEEDKQIIYACLAGEAVNMTDKLKGEPGPAGEKGEPGEAGEQGPAGPRVIVSEQVPSRTSVAQQQAATANSEDANYIMVLGKKVKVQKRAKN